LGFPSTRAEGPSESARGMVKVVEIAFDDGKVWPTSE
jgi:hypothetical protein